MVVSNKKIILSILMSLSAAIFAMEEPAQTNTNTEVVEAPDCMTLLPAELHQAIGDHLVSEGFKQRAHIGFCNKVLYADYLSSESLQHFFKQYLNFRNSQLIAQSAFSHPKKNVRTTLIKLLIDAKVPLRSIRDKEGKGVENYLMFPAIREDNKELILHYLENGADVNYAIMTLKEDEFGKGQVESESLLIYALIKKFYNPETSNEIIELLLKYGADVNFPGLPDNQLPLFLAAEMNDFELMKQLLDKGANPNALIGDNKATVLMSLAWGLERQPTTIMNKMSLLFSKKLTTEKDLMELLLRYSADPNIKALNGTTALMDAVDNLEKVKLLLAYGADCSIIDTSGRGALYYAQRVGNKKIINLLEEHMRNSKK